MEKVDRVVALVGALVLVGAVGYAATQDGAGGPQFALAYTIAETGVEDSRRPDPLPSTGGTFEFPAEVESANVSKVNVTVTFNAINAAGGSLRVVLKAPNGTVMQEAEQDLGSGGPGNAVGATVSLETVLAPVPADARGAYASLDEARAALAQGFPEAVGTWVTEVTFASGTTPALQVQVGALTRIVTWSGAAEPVAPESR